MEAPLSVEERLRQLADLAVPGIADWCAVHLVRGDRVDQVAVAHSDPAKVAFVAQLQERYPPDPDAAGGAHPGRAAPASPRSSPRSPTSCSSPPPSTTSTSPSSGRSGCARRWSCRWLVRGRQPGRAHPGARRVRAALRPRPTSRSPSSWPRPPRSRWTTPGLYEEQWRIAHTLQAALLPTDLPDGARAAPRRPLPLPPPTPTSTSAATSTTSCRSGTGAGCRRGRRLRQGRRGRGADRADPAHRARRDRPRARARRGAGPAQPRDAPRERRAARPVRDRRAGPDHPHTDGRHRAAGQRGPPAAAAWSATAGPKPCRRRASCSASTRTSP